jgi:hypothetical protein
MGPSRKVFGLDPTDPAYKKMIKENSYPYRSFQGGIDLVGPFWEQEAFQFQRTPSGTREYRGYLVQLLN